MIHMNRADMGVLGCQALEWEWAMGAGAKKFEGLLPFLFPRLPQDGRSGIRYS